MKSVYKISVLLVSLCFFNLAEAVDISVPCDVSYVLCLDEFLDMTEKSQSIEQLVGQLPEHIKKNVTFKRGNNIEKTINGIKTIVGPHGHLAPTNESSSATPAQPRVFVWDEKSGFAASWNSGNQAHTAFDRLDIYGFDFVKREHKLLAWTHQEGLLPATTTDKNGRSCVTCHGEVQRPIFPMYPDWPQFYGEFNDEMAGYGPQDKALRSDLKVLSNDFQPKERALYFDFLDNEGKSNERYTFILDAKPDNDNPYYPYRPRNTTSPFSDVSRAFYHRPNLRLGVLFNRLTALQVFEKLKASPVFKKFPDIIFYSLLDCNWDFDLKKGPGDRIEILSQFIKGINEVIGEDVNLRGAAFTPDDIAGFNSASFISKTSAGATTYYKHKLYSEPGYQQIPYEDLLKVLGLQLADMDIRFRHDSSIQVAGKFNIYDPKAYYFSGSAMDMGYIQETYKLNPICDNQNSPCRFSYLGTYMQGMSYFNSYFDGSATMNELLVAQILLYLTDPKQDFSKEPELAAVRTLLRQKIPEPTVYFETLFKKYSGFEERLKLDKTFFTRMDILSPWIQLPYPPDLLNIHNREAFWGSGAKTQAIRMRHAQWTSVDNRNSGIQNRNNGQNICWNVYDSMKARYLKQ